MNKIMVKINILCFVCLMMACASKPYTYYLIEPQIEVPKSLVEREDRQSVPPAQIGTDRVIKARWNDGKVFSEIDIPLLTSGQRIIIAHNQRSANQDDTGATIVPPPPSENDTAHETMRNSYLSKGYQENNAAAEVSLAKSRDLIDQAVKRNDYISALRLSEHVLKRFPEHVEFLRAKGSILLLLGDRSKALEIYEQAQDIEFDPAVESKIKELEQFE